MVSVKPSQETGDRRFLALLREQGIVEFVRRGHDKKEEIAASDVVGRCS